MVDPVFPLARVFLQQLSDNLNLEFRLALVFKDKLNQVIKSSQVQHQTPPVLRVINFDLFCQSLYYIYGLLDLFNIKGFLTDYLES